MSPTIATMKTPTAFFEKILARYPRSERLVQRSVGLRKDLANVSPRKT